MQLRGNEFHRLQHFQVKIEGKIRVEPADNVNLRCPLVICFDGPVPDLGQIVDVGPLLAGSAGERTELAAVNADVGVVDVPVNVEEDPPPVLPLVRLGSQFSDGQQVGTAEEEQRILIGQALTPVDFFGDGCKRRHVHASPPPVPQRRYSPCPTPSTSRTFPTTKSTRSSTVRGP